MDIGKRIRSLREERGLTQREVARRAGLTPSGVGFIEHGQTRNPSAETVVAIARALGVPVEELLGKPVPLADPLPSLGPEEDIGDFLKRLGSTAQYLADPTLPDRIQSMDALEALEIGRAAVKEAELVGPELRRRYEAAPDGSMEKVLASKELVVVSSNSRALRMALRARFAGDPAASGRDLTAEAEELGRALAMVG